MNRGTIRSVGIFTVIAVILLMLVVGGVRLVKTRNAHYATQPAPTTVEDTPEERQPSTQPPQEKPSDTKPSPQSSPQQQTKPETAQPTPSVPSQTPSTGVTAAPAQVPVTGPATDVFFTIVLMMLAVYFGIMLRRARATYRRLLS